MGIGDWGLGIGHNPQYPIPNPQLNIKQYKQNKVYYKIYYKNIHK